MALPLPLVAAAAGAEGDGARPRFEVAEVVRAHGEEYLRTLAASPQPQAAPSRLPTTLPAP